MGFSFSFDPISTWMNWRGTRDTNKTNRDIANQTNQTNIDLANTSYQRRVKDLEAAGLNPMLAYTQGGADSPSMMAPSYTSPALSFNSAQATMTSKRQADLLEAQARTQETQQGVNKAIEIKTLADAEVSTASAAEIKARTPTYQVSIQEALARVDKISQDTKLSFFETMKVKKEIVNTILTGQQIQFRTDNIYADTELKKLAKSLNRTELPAKLNKQGAAETWWGRNITPFLPDLSVGAKLSK